MACLRSLGPRGVHTIVTSEHTNIPAFASRYCDESIVLPSPHEDILEYKDALLSIAARPDVRTLVPFREEDIYVLSKFRDAFREHANPVVPPMETLRSVHDRLRLFEIANEAGLSVPETRSLDDIDDWDRDLIVKSRYLIVTGDYQESYSMTECDKYQGNTKYFSAGETPDLAGIRDEMNHVPIAQELVPGDGKEYAFAALYDRGEPVSTYQKRQLRGRNYAGGASVYRESIYEPEIEAAGRAILDHLDWHGLAEVEFLKNAETGEFELMEINPRMWGSLQCAVKAGADFPYHYWLLAGGERDRIEPGYDLGVATHYLFGEFQYLYSVLSDDFPTAERPSLGAAAWDVLSSCYEQPNFDYLSTDDPGPAIRGILNMVA